MNINTQKEAKKSQSRPFAEIRIRDPNSKLNLQLYRQWKSYDKDIQLWHKENEKDEKNILIELAKILESKPTPTIDEWFSKRKVKQVSLQPLSFGQKRRVRKISKQEDSQTVVVENTVTPAEYNRLLVSKQEDWYGLTSVSLPRRRPATAHPSLSTTAPEPEIGVSTPSKKQKEKKQNKPVPVRPKTALLFKRRGSPAFSSIYWTPEMLDSKIESCQL